jgi:hypothetical protein
MASVLLTRRLPTSIIVELFPVAGFTRLETLAVARAAAVVGELEVPARLGLVAGRFPGTSQVMIGAADFAFT